MLDIEIARNQEARVGGNQISGGKPDDVSRHHVTPANFFPLPAAQDGCRRGNLIAQLFDGALRTIRLTEVDRPTQQNNNADDSRIDRVAHECRYDGGNQQDQHQRIHKHMQEIGEKRMVLCRCRLIRPELVEPSLELPVPSSR